MLPEFCIFLLPNFGGKAHQNEPESYAVRGSDVGRTDGREGRLTDDVERMDGRTDGRTGADGRTDGRMGARTNGRTEGQGQIDGWTD